MKCLSEKICEYRVPTYDSGTLTILLYATVIKTQSCRLSRVVITGTSSACQGIAYHALFKLFRVSVH